MGTAGKVNSYTDKLYIIFFKCNWEDGGFFQCISMRTSLIHNPRTARNSLIGFTKEGLEALQSDSLRTFQGNPSLAAGCRDALQFYSSMAKNDIPKLTDYYLKQENFDKIKKSVEAKGNNRTQEDVDQYNKAVKDINSSVNSFNRLTRTLIVDARK